MDNNLQDTANVPSEEANVNIPKVNSEKKRLPRTIHQEPAEKREEPVELQGQWTHVPEPQMEYE
jgi:hypothetical protein